jgi:hypothetical protein
MKKVSDTFLVFALTVAPYGNVSTQLAQTNPWRAFQADDPVLTEIRVESLTGVDCLALTSSLVADRRDIHQMEVAAPESAQNQDWGTWTPFDSKELDQIQDCDDFPCAQKLDRSEVALMKAVSKENRPAKFLTLVLERMRGYLQNGTRKSYEFDGGIADPWALFEKRGLKTDLSRPVQVSLGERVLDFHESRMRPIRQILDRRTAVFPGPVDANSKRKSKAKRKTQSVEVKPAPTEASVWVRDVYVNHYFDSWGEWGNVQCDPQRKEAVVTLALSLEVDLLKKTDLFSSLAKGTMRGSIEKLAREYLDRWAGELKK